MQKVVFVKGYIDKRNNCSTDVDMTEISCLLNEGYKVASVTAQNITGEAAIIGGFLVVLEKK